MLTPPLFSLLQCTYMQYSNHEFYIVHFDGSDVKVMQTRRRFRRSLRVPVQGLKLCMQRYFICLPMKVFLRHDIWHVKVGKAGNRRLSAVCRIDLCVFLFFNLGRRQTTRVMSVNLDVRSHLINIPKNRYAMRTCGWPKETSRVQDTKTGFLLSTIQSMQYYLKYNHNNILIPTMQLLDWSKGSLV